VNSNVIRYKSKDLGSMVHNKIYADVKENHTKFMPAKYYSTIVSINEKYPKC